jgi:hypothetical protein
LLQIAAFKNARTVAAGEAKAGRRQISRLDIAGRNELRLWLGWTPFDHGAGLGALAPAKFRALTEEVVKSALTVDRPAPGLSANN